MVLKNLKLKPPPLMLVCFFGLALGVICTSALAFFSIYPGRYGYYARRPGGGDPFHRGLREYDILFSKYGAADNPGGDAGGDAGVLNRTLDRLEKMTLGVESRLSILKRRRNLARRDSRYQGLYREKALKAAEDFPYTESLAAVAAEALLTEKIDFNDETRGLLKDLSSRIRDTSLSPLVLAIHILSGDLEEPSRAAAIPGMDDLFSSALAFPEKIPPSETKIETKREDLLADAAILSILAGDIPAALARINTYLVPADISTGGGDLLRDDFPRFAAEFFYDFGNPQRAADLFSLFPDTYSRSRTADSLWLSGRGTGARNIWTVLSLSSNAARNRSLYNLAVSAGNQQEELIRLEELFAEADRSQNPWHEDPLNAEDVYIYGIIRYTRLLDSPRALAILDRGRLASHPLLDLEIHRRRQENLSPERAVADTWMLLGRHPGNENLHQWACWYFTYQRRYDELALLINSIEKQGNQGIAIGGPWLELHKSLALMRDLRLEEAAQKLQPLAADPAAAPFWQIPANLGRIMESRRSFSAALGYYEIASAEVKDPKAASEVQYRISQCLRALGQGRESRRVLEYALDLNPDNLKARAELSRLDSLQVY